MNYRNWEDTRRCVRSIYENPPREDYTIILVDNASETEPDFDLRAFLERYQIRFIQNMINSGYNAGNNRGVAEALKLGCDAVLVSNNDIRYFKDSIQAMWECLQRRPAMGIAGPMIVDGRGRVQKHILCKKTGLKEKYMLRTRANILFRKSRRAYFGENLDDRRAHKVYAVPGCCFMMSAGCAGAVTPFDTHTFLYEEELILGIQMEEQGWATVYYPKAVVQHLHGCSTRRRKAFAFAHNVRSEIYYCRKYLHAAGWQIYPLYCYRVLLYVARCMWSRDFRRHWRWFLALTKKELEMDV